MALSLQLFGKFTIRDGCGVALSLPTRKTCALLAYLAVNADRPQSRDQLVALLWGDRGERQARQSLSHALRSIQKLGAAQDTTLLDIDGEHVTLRSKRISIDIVRFQALRAEQPADAVDLYQGPFLDGLVICERAFEDWLAANRSEFHDLACDAHGRMATLAAEIGDNSGAIDAAKLLVRLDPMSETGYQLLIELLLRTGDRIGALRQYRTCAEMLQKEFGVEPSSATKVLYESIIGDASSGRRKFARPHAFRPTPQQLTSNFLTPPNPRHLTPQFVGTGVISALILFGSMLVPWQNSGTEQSDLIFYIKTPMQLTGEATGATPEPKTFGSAVERNGWYAGAIQGIEQIYGRRLESQESDWKALDCVNATNPNTKHICRDIAFEIRHLEHQKSRELHALRQEYELAIVSPPVPVADVEGNDIDNTTDALDKARTRGNDVATTFAAEFAVPQPAASPPALSGPAVRGDSEANIVVVHEKGNARSVRLERFNEKKATTLTEPVAQNNRQPNTAHMDGSVEVTGLAIDGGGLLASKNKRQTDAPIGQATIPGRNPSTAPGNIVPKITPTALAALDSDVIDEAKAKPGSKKRDTAQNADSKTAKAPARMRHQTRAEIERYWRERIEAVKREGPYEYCELDYDSITIPDCRERANKLRMYEAALKTGRPFLNAREAMIAAVAKRQSRAEIERYWLEQIEAVKRDGRHKDCWKVHGYSADPRRACRERAEKIEEYTEALREGRLFPISDAAVTKLRVGGKPRVAFEKFVRDRVKKLKDEGAYEDCELYIYGGIDPSAFADCEERGEKIQKLWAMLYTGEVPGHIAIAMSSSASNDLKYEFELDRGLVHRAISEYYGKQGYLKEPGPISVSVAGISNFQIKSMHVREVMGNRVVVDTRYAAEMADDHEVFSLASDFTLLKENGAYRVVAHEPNENRM